MRHQVADNTLNFINIIITRSNLVYHIKTAKNCEILCVSMFSLLAELLNYILSYTQSHTIYRQDLRSQAVKDREHERESYGSWSKKETGQDDDDDNRHIGLLIEGQLVYNIYI
jgi:hypothetical protein